jgi:hypothetical protein
VQRFGVISDLFKNSYNQVAGFISGIGDSVDTIADSNASGGEKLKAAASLGKDLLTLGMIFSRGGGPKGPKGEPLPLRAPKRSAPIRPGSKPGKWEVNGIEYKNFQEAAEAAGVPVKAAKELRPEGAPKGSPLTGNKYAQEAIPLSEAGRAYDNAWNVKMFTAAEREAARVVAGPRSKLVWAQTGKPVTTTDRSIFVMDTHGNIYIVESSLTVKHSSPLAGREGAVSQLRPS